MDWRSSGIRAAVEEFLRSEGLWASSKKLDLRRLKSLFGIGADVAQAASEIAANSARWLKLTPESAHLYKKYGLMETKTPGVSHAMVGKPGSIQKWLQVEQGPGSLLTNPAMLSGAAGIMAQVAMQQAMADITDYLATIDEKVDDVLRKQDDAVVAQMVGTGHVIERAMTIREETGGVNETLWSTVHQAHATIGATQAYALDQLEQSRRSWRAPRSVASPRQPGKQSPRFRNGLLCWLAASNCRTRLTCSNSTGCWTSRRRSWLRIVAD